MGWATVRPPSYVNAGGFDRCPDCGYSLEGLADHGRCPECGFAYGADLIVLYGKPGSADAGRRAWEPLVSVVAVVTLCSVLQAYGGVPLRWRSW
jgi:hypothetical protein